jgi:ABC-2 type transport system ATP-binding protein
MQQRLGLAVALLGRPDLVLLDEPTSALDPVGRQDVRGIIGSLRDRGTTVILNSHLLTEVERVCDRVAIVDHGRVVAELSVAELTRERGVSVRVTGLDDVGRKVAARYAPARVDGEWLFVDGIAEADVPRLVGELVARGGAVHAVIPTRHTLEERFMSLLAQDGAGGADRPGADRPGADRPGADRPGADRPGADGPRPPGTPGTPEARP